MSIALLLQRMSFVQPEHGSAPITGEIRERLHPMLADVRSDSETVGLRLSVKQIDRINSLLELEGGTLGQLANALAELHNRIGDEIQEATFIQITPDKAAFMNDLAVAESLGSALADAATDLETAGRCIAFSLNTAGAFHLMRVVEYCLLKFSERLGKTFANQESWGPVIAELDSAISRLSKAEKAAFAEALTHFISVKNAWRNPTMHVGRTYDDGQVMAIYMSVRFMIDALKPILESATPQT